MFLGLSDLPQWFHGAEVGETAPSDQPGRGYQVGGMSSS